MKSAIYVVNSNDNTVSVGGNIPLGSAVHGFGNDITLSGNEINLANGYYSVSSSVDITATATGVVTVNLLQDGNIITSAFVSLTSGDSVSISIPTALIRVKKCCGSSLTWTVTTTSATITNFSTEVVEV